MTKSPNEDIKEEVEQKTKNANDEAQAEQKQTEPNQADASQESQNQAGSQEEPPVKLEDLSIDELRKLVVFQKQLNDELMKDSDRLIKEKEKLEQQKSDLSKLISKSDQYLDQLVAMKRDFESYKARIRSDADMSRDEGKVQAIEKVIPFLDTLEKARVDIRDGKAFELIFRQFNKILFEMGVTEIEVLNLPFDPNTANAITSREVEEDKKNTVVEIYQKGYKFKDRILRYAQVIVGK